MRPIPRVSILICAAVLAALFLPPEPSAWASPAAGSLAAGAAPAGGALLIENVGQFDPRARFLLRGGGVTLWLAEDALWATALMADADGPASDRAAPPEGGVHLRLSFAGANPSPRLEPFGRLDARVSFFRSGDPSAWHADVPAWAGVRYVDIYPGVDLEITAAGNAWAWRVVPRTDDGAALLGTTVADAGVRLRVEGTDGATIDGSVALLTTSLGTMALPLLEANVPAASSPEATAASDGSLELSCPFAGSPTTLEGAVLTAGSADLLYSTFLGGTGVDTGRDVALDEAGNAYVTGETWSTDFPVTPGAFDTTPSTPEVDSDAFVAKFAADGGLIYATFVGGAGHDNSYAVAVDAAGSAYITGETQSPDFPTTVGAFDDAYSTVGWSDAFVVKLDTTGAALAYATYLGGSDTDIGYGIAVDGAGSAYVTGYTGYTDPGMEEYEPFPTTGGAFDETHNGTVGDTDAFVVKLNPAGSGLAYGTFFGAGDRDEAYAVAADGAGCAYVTGMSQSSDLPVTAGAFATTHGGDDDAFVLKLSPGGEALDYAAFLGSSDSDWGYGIAVDNVGAAYVTGFTASSTFPTTTGAFDTSHNGEYDAFVTRVNADGASLSYSTFLGGALADKGRAIAVDDYWCAYVTGETYSQDMPVIPGAFDTTTNGQKDAFVAKLNTSGSGLAYGSYLGGLDEDVTHGIAVGAPGSAIVAGETGSYNYPTTSGAYDIGYNFGGRDAVVSRLSMPGGEQPTPTPTCTPSPTATAGPSPTPTTGQTPTPTTGPSPTATVGPSPTATSGPSLTPTATAAASVSPTPTSTAALPTPTPTDDPGGYPAPSATATPIPSPTPDPRLWAREYLPSIHRP